MESQGILSSRIFRKPTSEFQATTILEIRPFSEEQIINILHKSGVFNTASIENILVARADLIPIIRNPFMAQLLSEFVKNHPSKLPENQSELFKEYISSTFLTCNEKILRAKLTKEYVYKTTIEIANLLFQRVGLETSIDEISRQLDGYPVKETIDILTYTRIGRLGTGNNSLFSFSHRRFCEYFAIQKIIETGEQLDVDSIPNDSQWRDAYVLYCEVVDIEKAKYIANFCWETIKTLNDPSNLQTIHCMRFLRDAFKGRPSCIDDFKSDLASFILSQLEIGSNINSAKLSLESISLLDEESRNIAIINALKLNIQWFEETALKSCRYISSINRDLKSFLLIYIYQANILFFIVSYYDLKYAFSLSDSFIHIVKSIRIKLLETIIILSLNLICISFFTELYLILFIFYFVIYSAVFGLIGQTKTSQTYSEEKLLEFSDKVMKFNLLTKIQYLITDTFFKVNYSVLIIEKLRSFKFSDILRITPFTLVVLLLSMPTFKMSFAPKVTYFILFILLPISIFAFLNVMLLKENLKRYKFKLVVKYYSLALLQVTFYIYSCKI